MSRPRQVLPGSTYLLSRRISERRFFLVPARWVNEIFLYCMAVAAGRTGVTVHAYCVMSNHWHAVVSDPEARLPEFAAFVHKYVAKCMNAKLDRTENFWAAQPYSAVRLEDAGAVVDKIAYTQLNPVAQFLVRRARLWPGLTSAGLAFGDTVEVKRPTVFFRQDGPMPETARFTLRRPPHCRLSNADYTALVAERVEEREQEIAAEARQERIRFKTRDECYKERRGRTPRNRTPLCSVSPRLAAQDAEIRQLARERERAFLEHYYEAREAWQCGKRRVVFPPGTYWLRVHANVKCATGSNGWGG